MSGLILSLLFAVAAAGQADEPPPLTEAQRLAIGALARETHAEAERLKGLLAEKEQRLAELYTEYLLDLEQASELESEILELQRQMLANYRRLQVGLREQVGRERFLLLKRRLDSLLQSERRSASDPSPSSAGEPR